MNVHKNQSYPLLSTRVRTTNCRKIGGGLRLHTYVREKHMHAKQLRQCQPKTNMRAAAKFRQRSYGSHDAIVSASILLLFYSKKHSSSCGFARFVLQRYSHLRVFPTAAVGWAGQRQLK